ncbi:hypothetical protein CSC33_2301 [Pseudomonas aeruginosa]|uniref:hypothetical protein n=1 Tax=Pseudomonas aeruginosa TaxID=287 RepID=UPI000D74AB1F|nr:hypothetical protein [Pseudomonas aeruginosa]AWQ84688.1 hypothetical protein CSC33_2301 [Pseudomonas aeruginosa]
MSDVTRYTFDMAACWHEHPDGEFVEHNAYAKLAAEAQALREEVAALRARVIGTPLPAITSAFCGWSLMM